MIIIPSISLRQRYNYASREFGSELCLEETSRADPQAIRDWLFLARAQSGQYPVCSNCRDFVSILMRRNNMDWGSMDLRSYNVNQLVMGIRRNYYSSSISRDSYEDTLGW